MILPKLALTVSASLALLASAAAAPDVPLAAKRRWAVDWTDLGAYEDLLVERLVVAR